MTRHAEYLRQRSFCSKVTLQTQTHTHTHTHIQQTDRTTLSTKGLFDYQIWIRIHNESESKVTLDTPNDLKSFDLPSECEPKFTENPDPYPDPIIE